MKGYVLALCSVALVSMAQLLLRWAMIHLPNLTQQLPAVILSAPAPFLILTLGLAAYGLSMICWLLALHYLPLSRAYPLLSLSYVLVWLAAVLLPTFNEAFRWSSLAGMILILIGLLCINVPPARK